jgi:hypothetical protein
MMPAEGRIGTRNWEIYGPASKKRHLMRSILEFLHLTRFSPSVLAVTGATAIVATTLFGGATMATLSHATVTPADPFKVATVAIDAVSTNPTTNATTGSDHSVFGDVAMANSTVTIDNVVPGDQWVRYITLTNNGSVNADFAFRADASDNAGGALVNGVTTGSGRSFTLQVDQCTDSTCGSVNPLPLYAAGALTTDPNVTNFLNTTNPVAGVAPNGTEYLKLTLSYPGTYDDFTPGVPVEGKSAWINFTWKATQNATVASTTR